MDFTQQQLANAHPKSVFPIAVAYAIGCAAMSSILAASWSAPFFELGMTEEEVSSVYKTLWIGVFVAPAFGGLLVDISLGIRRGAIVGLSSLTVACICLMIPVLPVFLAGIFFAILGSAFFLPALLKHVSLLYRARAKKRLAGFALLLIPTTILNSLGFYILGGLPYALDNGWLYATGTAALLSATGTLVFLGAPNSIKEELQQSLALKPPLPIRKPKRILLLFVALGSTALGGVISDLILIVPSQLQDIQMLVDSMDSFLSFSGPNIMTLASIPFGVLLIVYWSRFSASPLLLVAVGFGCTTLAHFLLVYLRFPDAMLLYRTDVLSILAFVVMAFGTLVFAVGTWVLVAKYSKEEFRATWFGVKVAVSSAFSVLTWGQLNDLPYTSYFSIINGVIAAGCIATAVILGLYFLTLKRNVPTPDQPFSSD